MILFKILSYIFIIFIIRSCIKEVREILVDNKKVNKKIKEQDEWNKEHTNYWERRNTFSKDDLKNPIKPIWSHFWYGVLSVMFALVLSFLISFIICTFYQPMEDYDYNFKINSLKDNLVTTGDISGGIFCVTGSIDGEINYYYSRTMVNGDKIGHIPANKTYVKYKNDSNPKIAVYKERANYPEWFEKLFFAFEVDELKYYVITVPEGTMINNGTYEIDLE